MKILVFEYVCGGGLAGEPIPASMAKEGRMMLQALLNELKQLPGVRIMLPLDQRCTRLSVPAEAEVFEVKDRQSLDCLFPRLIDLADAVWPVAPESDGVLAAVVDAVRAQGKPALVSDARTIRLFTDKYATLRALTALGLPCVPTGRLDQTGGDLTFPVVIKPIDGVGCAGNRVLGDNAQLMLASACLENPAAYIVQPFVDGEAMSLSCLFGRGKAWLLSCNRQRVRLVEERFELQACRVNVKSPNKQMYTDWIKQMAIAMPGLWGYVGIDLIENRHSGPRILEVNPRLTTSYVGISAATGINVAQQVLNLWWGEVNIEPRVGVSVEVRI
ncbi:ATP-grasp domain-containing protein [Methylomonas sp. HYX-M1]|uniref:ATP-grasp domain-containing protein n=1 Tax=Methylomonas sp. HYX-M1 TaxID=3139307 RepID=UPI00345C1434